MMSSQLEVVLLSTAESLADGAGPRKALGIEGGSGITGIDLLAKSSREKEEWAMEAQWIILKCTTRTVVEEATSACN
jgi:hypothetical protein